MKYLLALAACTVIAAPTIAQDANNIRPFKSLQFNAQRVDTARFSPQINDEFVSHAKRPENPIRFGDEVGPPNNLTLGQTLNAIRGTVNAQWPAIGATGWTPPDPDIAVGPNHVVAVVNSSIAFYNKSGTPLFQQTAQDFYTGLGAGSFRFDPKCFYDRNNQRFVMLFLEQDDSPQVSKLLIAVSDDADPNGIWHKYRIESKLTVGQNTYWLDYPGLGYNKDAYVISGNMFGFSSGFGGVQFIVLPTAPMLTGSPVTAQYLRDANGESAQMTEVMDGTLNAIFAISRENSTAMQLYAIRDLATAPVMNMALVTVPSNSMPSINAPTTNGHALDALDGRIINAVWRSGAILATHTVQSSSRLRVRWYQIATNNWPVSGSPSLTMSGEVAGATGIHHHMPAVNMNSVGDVSMIFTRSSTSITADMMYAGRFATDPAGTMGTPVLLESSAGNNYGSGRWGDYFDVDVDPVDDVTFWGILMGVALNNGWRTSIFSWTITQPGTSLAPTTMTMERGILFSGSVNDLGASDDVRATFRPGITFTSGEAPVQVRLDAVSSVLAPSTMRIVVESQASAGGMLQTIEAFDYVANAWEQVDGRNAMVGSDGVVDISLTNPARFVDAGGNVSMKLHYKPTAPVFTYPWNSALDKVAWIVAN
ncbi:MAG: hypothetical protein ABIV13_02500 [Fimbriimonadales bacterium]